MSAIRTFSFKKGYRRLTLEQTIIVREKVKEALSLNNNSFYRRLRGEVEPRVTEAEAIEKIFAEFGVKNIWGE